MKAKYFVALAMGFGLAACAIPKKLILSSGMVSMTERGGDTANLKEIGPARASYCGGDSAISTTDKNIGLIDEVTLRAQTESKAKYIKNAQYYSQGTCVSIEGTALR